MSFTAPATISFKCRMVNGKSVTMDKKSLEQIPGLLNPRTKN
jgi:hypothetical protein